VLLFTMAVVGMRFGRGRSKIRGSGLRVGRSSAGWKPSNPGRLSLKDLPRCQSSLSIRGRRAKGVLGRWRGCSFGT